MRFAWLQQVPDADFALLLRAGDDGAFGGGGPARALYAALSEERQRRARLPGPVGWPLDGTAYLVCPKARCADTPGHAPIANVATKFPKVIECACGERFKAESAQRMEAY